MGRVWLDGKDVGLAQVCAGHAWVYRDFLDELCPADQLIYVQCEEEARREAGALWRDDSPIPPREWRKH